MMYRSPGLRDAQWSSSARRPAGMVTPVGNWWLGSGDVVYVSGLTKLASINDIVNLVESVTLS